jgi:prophage regulatory protein
MKPLVVDMEQLLQLLPALSKSTIEEERRQGRFPVPLQLSARRVGWLLSEVEEWVATRQRADLAPPPNTGAKKPRRRAPDPQAAHPVA